MNKESRDKYCCDICFIPYEGNKSYELISDVSANSNLCYNASEKELLERGYEKYKDFCSFRYKKEYRVCYKCFVDKYDPYYMSCPGCINRHDHSKSGSTIHQKKCKKCNKNICELNIYLYGHYELLFCEYCPGCCQGLKLNCNMCGNKYNKRYCKLHTNIDHINTIRCEQDHCRECCKKAHICMICNSTSDEKFKFDDGIIYHINCYHKGKLECIKCNKKYIAKSFCKGIFEKKICKNCIICIECEKKFVKDKYNMDYFSQTNQLVCLNCLDKKRICKKCGDINNTNRYYNYIFCIKCMICEKCKKNCYKENEWHKSVVNYMKKNNKVMCYECLQDNSSQK